MQILSQLKRLLLKQQRVAQLVARLIIPDELCRVAVVAHALKQQRPVLDVASRQCHAPPAHVHTHVMIQWSGLFVQKSNVFVGLFCKYEHVHTRALKKQRPVVDIASRRNHTPPTQVCIAM